ncbi:DUF6545 domain-containing protein [Nocardia sp. NPDC050710]|uniref:DUF6545 domain-containing protein n=1 Tax=Nocardia sp. NPDC050710 TaxID=3157220 RepID=UPI0033C683AB
MNTAPPAFSVTIVVVVVVITAGRWLLVRETATDLLINRALGWDVLGVCVFATAVAHGNAELGQRLFLAIGAMAISNACGFVRLLDGASVRTFAARQRRYDGTAAVFVTITVACTVAEAAGADLQSVLDWEGILSAVLGICIAGIGLGLARTCVRELKLSGQPLRERLTFSALLVFALYDLISASSSVIRGATGAPPRDAGPVWAIASFIAFALLGILLAIPLAQALLARAGLDRAGRDCRRLWPLWRDLTAAVPEVVLHPHDRGSASRLYRMTVEIQDALLHLRQFAPAVAHRAGAGADEYGLRIAYAARLERCGIDRTAHPDRATELRALLELARRWDRPEPRARRVGPNRYLAAPVSAGVSLSSR